MTWMSQFVPPNLKELLEKHLPNGAQWYETRSGNAVAAYAIEDYDEAILNARHMMKISPGVTSVFYVWKESGSLCEQRMF